MSKSGLIVIAVLAMVVTGIALFVTPAPRITAKSILTSNPAERPFAQGGNISMQLSAGGYEIHGTPSDVITVSYRNFGRPDRDVRVALDTKENNANLVIEGPSDNFHARIEIPEKSNLYARLTAGQIKVDGVTGSKDLETKAGQMIVDVGDPKEYGTVYASVYSGNLQAYAWSEVKSGLMRSFRLKGPGKYGLHAHVGAGELILKSTGLDRRGTGTKRN